MAFNLNFPQFEEERKQLHLELGQMAFVVGPNGSGKSSLMQQFATQNRGRYRRISAHRQVWFNNNSLELTPATRDQNETNILNQDIQETARYVDHHAHARSQITIFDLIDSENTDARNIASALRSGDSQRAEELAAQSPPLEKLNRLLSIANLDIEISVDDASRLLARKAGSEPYSIAALSDGERNAILICASVLTAKQGMLILLDEPERHLHRSIVSPLLTSLLAIRNDCAFIVSTHDISLPLDQAGSEVVVLREYVHNPRKWDVDIITDLNAIDESVARTILGSRKKVLFVEGVSSSLDMQIYQLAFPDISVVPSNSCVDVEKIVRGLKASVDHHRTRAIGLVDRDFRSGAEVERLRSEGIISLEQYSVESIYYHPRVLEIVARSASNLFGYDPVEVVRDATSRGIRSLLPNQERLAYRLVEKRIRDALMRSAPTWSELQDDPGRQNINLDISDFVSQERETIAELFQTGNYLGLISRYPIRESNLRDEVAKALHFTGRNNYEDAVRTQLVNNDELKAEVLTILQPLAEEIANDP
jgi:ABC-type cobalamin/Fe3+-siderophores transport system ATPase subunit